MEIPRSTEHDFLFKITKIIEENISNEQFGVSELASETGMSRSNLLRKVKQLTNLSASQFIRQVRLQRSMNMLKQTSLTVSEVSYRVGFSSPSYFVKCFKDYYGYPPGEAGKETPGEKEFAQIDQTSKSHQLAAIMFTDIQGYTALMQQDEKRAIEIRNRHREVFNATTAKYSGRILQYYGDGTLSIFNSAIDAVQCGIEIQLEYLKDPTIPVRIGIHTGDIIYSDEEIIGDGVNVASRIESLAVPGSVLISDKVYDEIKNQTGIKTTSLGVFELKNVNKPVEVYSITNTGLEVPQEGQLTGKIKRRTTQSQTHVKKISRNSVLMWVLALCFLLAGGYIIYSQLFKKDIQSTISTDHSRKSIAVLPFINDSNDSSNIYIINGLMESTLNNLQKIKDLRVISRTSVEKYRNMSKTIPEIGKELGVDYLIEGSGQKIGDQILLNIQLIQAPMDKHLWSEQYNREVKDIFELQKEVARKITDEIKVYITPEEEERINKLPTENLAAYDYFLKGFDLLTNPTPENAQNSIPFFEQAIELDPGFARAYADLAIAYYYLDEHMAEKKYTKKINFYADKALLHDDQLPQSLISKALYYLHNKEYELAISYFEKTLEYHPNNGLVYIWLVNLYVNYVPDTEKYLEYALKGLEVNVAATYDSSLASYSFLHISNAFIQSGFIDEAEGFANKSLTHYSGNLFSEHLKAFILFAREKDLHKLKKRLLKTFKKDMTRVEIIQDIGKIYYYLGEYDSAYYYYKIFNDVRKTYNLDIYNSENAKIGLVYDKMGMAEESEEYFSAFKEYADKEQSIYKHYNLTLYHAYKGDTRKALEHFELFSQEENYHYWITLFTQLDPLVENIKDLSEFKKTMRAIEVKFWKYHKEMKTSLKEKGLI